MESDRIERLKEVLSIIDLHRHDESSFGELYDLLKKEYFLEGRDDGKGIYQNNLRQTIQKQAANYIAVKKRRPKKGAPSEYSEFVSNFRTDVFHELPLVGLNRSSSTLTE
jgi:hypothetical protein